MSQRLVQALGCIASFAAGGDPIPLLTVAASAILDRPGSDAWTLYADALTRGWQRTREHHPTAGLGALDRARFLEHLQRMAAEPRDLLGLESVERDLTARLRRDGDLPEDFDAQGWLRHARSEFSHAACRRPDFLGPMLLEVVRHVQPIIQRVSKLEAGLERLERQQQAYTSALGNELDALSAEVSSEDRALLRQSLPHMLLTHGIVDAAERERPGSTRALATGATVDLEIGPSGDVSLRLGSEAIQLGDIAALLQGSFRRPLVRLQTKAWVRGSEATSALLRSEFECVPFDGRERQLAELVAWCESSDGLAIRFYRGAGGIGKTRLMRELCRQLLADPDRGWRAGFLDGLALADSVDAGRYAFAIGVRHLVVVDYVEKQRETLDRLFRAVLEERRLGNDAVIRVVLLARNEPMWWQDLRSAVELVDVPAEAAALEPVQLRREQSFSTAARAYAETLGIDADGPALASPPSALLQAAHFERVLNIHMLALLHVVGAHDGALGQTPDGELDLLDRMLSLEKRRHWERDIGTIPARTVDQGIERAMTLVTLGYAVPDYDSAITMLASLPGFESRPQDEPELLAEHCHHLYGGGRAWIEPLAPEVLGEHLVERVLCGRGSAHVRTGLRDALLALAFDDSGANVKQGLTVLTRLAQRRGTLGVELLEHVLEPRWDRLADVASEVMPPRTTSLRALAVTATQQALERADDPAKRAKLLNNLSVRLSDLGRRPDALSAIEEAVDWYRELVFEDRDTFLPELARALNNHSIHLNATGHRQEALTASEEALALRRMLSDTSPDAHLPGLATALANHSLRLRQVTRLDDARSTSDEAVSLRRALVQQQGESFLPGLARALTNHAVHESAAGAPEEALAAIEEGVQYYRQLSARNSDAYLPALATALNNLSYRLSAVGRHAEALSASDEALSFFRELAQRNRDAFQPDVATALDTFADALAAVGRGDDAVRASDEALRLLEPHFIETPGAYASWMQAMLDNHRARCERFSHKPDVALTQRLASVLHQHRLR